MSGQTWDTKPKSALKTNASTRRCSHCGLKGGEHAEWTIRLCADGRRKRVFHLCQPCDVTLNMHMLVVMGDKRVAEKMAKYRGDKA